MTVLVPVEASASSSDAHRAMKVEDLTLLLNLLNGLNGVFSLLAASFGATLLLTQKFSDPSADSKDSNHCQDSQDQHKKLIPTSVILGPPCGHFSLNFSSPFHDHFALGLHFCCHRGCSRDHCFKPLLSHSVRSCIAFGFRVSPWRLLLLTLNVSTSSSSPS